eukprot:1879623-Prymnesium_polylepis.1
MASISEASIDCEKLASKRIASSRRASAVALRAVNSFSSLRAHGSFSVMYASVGWNLRTIAEARRHAVDC